MGKSLIRRKSGSSTRYCEPSKTIVMTRCYIRECLSLLFLDLYRKTQIFFFLVLAVLKILLSVLLTFKTCKNASDVSLIDSYLCKMFSYRFPQP